MNETYIREFIVDNFLNEKDIEKIEDKILNENLTFLSAVTELNLLDPKTMNKIVSLFQAIPEIKLKNKAINLETLLSIPEPVVRTKKIIPFDENESEVFIAVANTDIDYDFLKQFFPKKEIKIFLADLDEINEKIYNYQKLLKENLLSGMFGNLNRITKLDDFGFQKEEDIPKDYFSDIANNLYTKKFVKELLEYAKTSLATHIYITNGEEKALISFRIFGQNYPIMEIDKNTVFSINIKLKKLADINIFSKKEIIREASFMAELNGEVEKIFLSFIKTINGESISLELAEQNDFGTDFITVSSEQREILFKNLNDHKGFYIISGEKQSGKTKTIYALIEEEFKKNKEIYSLEDEILHKIDFVNQILINKKTQKELLIAKLIQNSPDMIAVDYIKPYILGTLFNYVKFGGKVTFGIKNDIKTFVDVLLDFNFKKAEIVRNFNILLNHKKFKKLDFENKKEVFLKENEIKILEKVISKREILNLLKKENLITKKIKKVAKIPFYTKTKKSRDLGLVYLRGILDLGLTFEELFLKDFKKEKFKNETLLASQKSILENALILANRGEVDIKEVIKFLK